MEAEEGLEEGKENTDGMRESRDKWKMFNIYVEGIRKEVKER